MEPQQSASGPCPIYEPHFWKRGKCKNCFYTRQEHIQKLSLGNITNNTQAPKENDSSEDLVSPILQATISTADKSYYNDDLLFNLGIEKIEEAKHAAFDKEKYTIKKMKLKEELKQLRTERKVLSATQAELRETMLRMEIQLKDYVETKQENEVLTKNAQLMRKDLKELTLGASSACDLNLLLQKDIYTLVSFIRSKSLDPPALSSSSFIEDNKHLSPAHMTLYQMLFDQNNANNNNNNNNCGRSSSGGSNGNNNNNSGGGGGRSINLHTLEATNSGNSSPSTSSKKKNTFDMKKLKNMMQDLNTKSSKSDSSSSSSSLNNNNNNNDNHHVSNDDSNSNYTTPFIHHVNNNNNNNNVSSGNNSNNMISSNDNSMMVNGLPKSNSAETALSSHSTHLINSNSSNAISNNSSSSSSSSSNRNSGGNNVSGSGNNSSSSVVNLTQNTNHDMKLNARLSSSLEKAKTSSKANKISDHHHHHHHHHHGENETQKESKKEKAFNFIDKLIRSGGSSSSSSSSSTMESYKSSPSLTIPHPTSSSPSLAYPTSKRINKTTSASGTAFRSDSPVLEQSISNPSLQSSCRGEIETSEFPLIPAIPNSDEEPKVERVRIHRRGSSCGNSGFLDAISQISSSTSSSSSSSSPSSSDSESYVQFNRFISSGYNSSSKINRSPSCGSPSSYFGNDLTNNHHQNSSNNLQFNSVNNSNNNNQMYDRPRTLSYGGVGDASMVQINHNNFMKAFEYRLLSLKHSFSVLLKNFPESLMKQTMVTFLLDMLKTTEEHCTSIIRSTFENRKRNNSPTTPIPISHISTSNNNKKATERHEY